MGRPGHRSASELDVEQSRWRANDGFPAVSDIITRDPDRETFIFRRFDKLTARVLLHQQSEVLRLERELERLDKETGRSKDLAAHASNRNWEIFTERATQADGEERKRKDLFDNIRTKLTEYHEALLLESSIAKLSSPSSQALQFYRTELHGKDHDRCKLGGHSTTILDDEGDLVSLNPRKSTDMLSNFVLSFWPGPGNRNVGSSTEMEHVSEKLVSITVNVLTTIIAAVLLIGSILALYFETRPNPRLGLIILFIFLFSCGVRLTTNATRDSLFAATAAYAAVLVVFVSGDLGNNSGIANPITCVLLGNSTAPS